MGNIKIILADDHQMFLDGLASLLSQLQDVEVIATANSGREVMEKLTGLSPHLVIVDINMPVMNGLETTQEIKARYPQIKVLGLTMENDLHLVKAMLEAGASGYILKNTGKTELELALRQVMKGEPYLSQTISNQLAQNLLRNFQQKNEFEDPLRSLTERELEILKLIALEHSNTEIADLLFISPKTVETHRKNLMRKIEVKNSLGVYKFAVKHKLLEE
ncbi:response regulator transcription factor [Salinimicrobium sp. TH3]|uniref:response regulator transcription factor n=1 Tax=Salinimicrobium sp. TH3 TaxID=2997342 RepID=UPI0022746722|nr:response regulator transcription factor [Salinimicrobium sp. TH3]MCY2687613.1 response regulator transcription factor [Salinimicrobium sp. TH3]